jgi:hypothetical protein
MFSNVVVERNYKDEIYPRKAGGKDSPNKIDGPCRRFYGDQPRVAVHDVWRPGVYIVPGAVLLWIVLPTRRAFVLKDSQRKGNS